MSHPSLSIVIPTVGRTDSIDALLASIAGGSTTPIEVIVVDQNEDGRLVALLAKWTGSLPIVHIQTTKNGAAAARNKGAAVATGEYVHFPDDDSAYSADVLQKSLALLDNSQYAGVSGSIVDPATRQRAVIKFLPEPCEVRLDTIHKTTTEMTLVWRTDVFRKLGGFDESLGIGTYFGAEESADLMVRALQAGYRFRFEPDLVYFHAETKEQPVKKYLAYGRGNGRAFWKHRHVPELRRYYCGYFAKGVAGFCLFLAFRPARALRYGARAWGFAIGFVKSVKATQSIP